MGDVDQSSSCVAARLATIGQDEASPPFPSSENHTTRGWWAMIIRISIMRSKRSPVRSVVRIVAQDFKPRELLTPKCLQWIFRTTQGLRKWHCAFFCRAKQEKILQYSPPVLSVILWLLSFWPSVAPRLDWT
jgi:hypothetical protein